MFAGVLVVVFVFTDKSVLLGLDTKDNSFVLGSLELLFVVDAIVGLLALQLYNTCLVAFTSPSNSNSRAKGFPSLSAFSVITLSVSSCSSPKQSIAN